MDITSDNDGLYQSGFDAGAASVDITFDNVEIAFDVGVASVDITSDNDGLYQSGFDAGAVRISRRTIRLPSMRVSPGGYHVGQPGCVRRGCRLGGYHVGQPGCVR